MLFDEKDSEQIALNDLQNQRTWGELDANCLALANYLLQTKGLKENDHIALLVGNRLEFIEVMLAGILAGLWVTPINTHLVKEEINYIVEDSDANLIFFDKAHQDLLHEKVFSQGIAIESLDEIYSQAHSLDNQISLEGPAGGTMLYTSGTTGRPKGVKRNKPATLGEALQKMRDGARLFGLMGVGPHLVTGPLYHAAPMLFAVYDMLIGASMIIMPKWDTQEFIDIVKDHKVHTSHLVPTMFVRLLKHCQDNLNQSNFSSLKLVLHGAAPIAPQTKKDMISWWGPILLEYWGASEAGTTTLVTSEDWLNHPGTVGKALSYFDVYVGDEHGNKIDDEVGMLYCKHQFLEQVFEYHKAKNKTLEAHPQQNIFCIGDIGRVDKEGYVYLSDRKSNMIISGGVNIYPAEIEQVLINHPAIKDVAIFGIANSEWGEEVKAAVELLDNEAGSEDLAKKIIAFARDNMAHYKAPRSVDFHDSLPRTPTGKLLVRKLKEAYNN